jgi:hypothetical protein
MKKPGPIVISSSLMAKIEAAAPAGHYNASHFTQEANAALVMAREKGLTWSAIGDIFREQGWPVSRETLSKQLRAIKGTQGRSGYGR